MDKEPLGVIKQIRTPEYYRERLDPTRSLPKVTLVEQPTKLKGTLIPRDYLIRDASNNEIGKFTLAIANPPEGEPTASVAGIKLIDSARGQGYGRSTYMEILILLGDARRLHSGFQLSRGSAPIWDWLVEKGVARKISSLGVDEARENAGYSADEYEII